MLLFAQVVPSGLCAQQSTSKPEAVKKKIKEVRNVTQDSCEPDAKYPDGWKGLTWTSIYKYDSRGNRTFDYLDNGQDVIINTTFKYDDMDSVVEEEMNHSVTTRIEHKYTLNDKGKIVEDAYEGVKHTFKYDAAGNVLESAEFNGHGDLIAKTTNTYNDKEEIVEILVYGQDPSRTVYAYDGGGHKTQEETYDASGHLSSKTVYMYDSAGHRTKEEIYDASGHLSSKTGYAYDAAGHQTKEETYDASGHLSSKTVYTFDENGQNTKEEEFGSDGVTRNVWDTFKRDSKGFVIEDSHFKLKGECKSITKTTYEFYP